MPSKLHTVTQPEHLGAVASDAQLESFVKIWNHDDNAKLRKRRLTPHVLLPGDTVAVPERDPKIYERPTGKQHVFTVQLMPLKVRVVVLDPFEKPVANATGTFRADGSDEDVQTDGDGLFEASISHGTRTAQVTVGDVTYTLSIGHLDPIEESSGQLARLKALGYFDEDVPEAADFPKVEDDLSSAIGLAWELFQDENGLEPTGVPDDDSFDKLKEVFGQ